MWDSIKTILWVCKWILLFALFVVTAFIPGIMYWEGTLHIFAIIAGIIMSLALAFFITALQLVCSNDLGTETGEFEDYVDEEMKIKVEVIND